MKPAAPTAFEFYYVVLPLAVLAVYLVVLIWFGGQSRISNAQSAIAIIGVILAAGSSFLAYFEDRVRNPYAWFGIMLNGLMTILIFAAIHRSSGINCAAEVCQGKVLRDMTSAIYFSIVTFTTLRYGDLQPVFDRRLIAASEALIGYLYLGFLVGAAFHWASQPNDGLRR